MEGDSIIEGKSRCIFIDYKLEVLTTEQEWLQIKGKENRKAAPWTTKHEEDVNHAYFHYYSSSFDQPHIRDAWAQIPHLFQIDDHDMYV